MTTHLLHLIFISLNAALLIPVSVQQGTTIFHGGDILPISELTRPESIVVKGDRIVFVGDLEEAEATYPQSRKHHLHGNTLIPGFFDPHTHLFSVAMMAGSVNLQAPPIGTVDTISKLKEVLAHRAKHLKPGQWLVGMNYDHNNLRELRHPTRADLDEVSVDHPIFIFHVTVHFAVCNSRALEMTNITAKSQNPSGGKFVRYPKSTVPNGVLEEAPAFLMVLKTMTAADLGLTEETMLAGMATYAKNGITTVQEPGGSSKEVVELLKKLTAKSALPVDVILYPRFEHRFLIEQEGARWNKYQNGLRFGGIKLILDGAIQGHTAYFTEPYLTAPPGEDTPWYGYSLYPKQDELDKAVAEVLRNGWHLLSHTNGDAATDQLFSAFEKALAAIPALRERDHRTTIIHGQTIREEQVEQAKAYKMGISFFPGHIFYWGDDHVNKYLGLNRTNQLDPLSLALRYEVPMTIHNDAMVTPVSSLDVVYFAANRWTQSGLHIGPEHEIPVFEALKAVTLGAAYQHFEERDKGSLEVGKLADLAILSDNPLAIDKTKIRGIKVLQTFKRGRSIYKKDQHLFDEL